MYILTRRHMVERSDKGAPPCCSKDDLLVKNSNKMKTHYKKARFQHEYVLIFTV